MKHLYGYDELITTSKIILPNEFEIIEAMEMLTTRTAHPNFDPIPTLNDLCKSREAQRILGGAIKPFRNAALQRYENKEINESQLWDIVEKVVKSI
uniref:Uncharacterized protein n=1 Tax=Candidatus Desulfatibia profunda TaxID=2841695 RepID=A0A8J6TLQ8_9BACT|nr:hypothetical protein [Candidatus Desulfatibia profunda]